MVQNLYDYGLNLENLYGRNTIGNTAEGGRTLPLPSMHNSIATDCIVTLCNLERYNQTDVCGV
jgi:hypothetical protein